MKSPLRVGAIAAPKRQFLNRFGRPPSGKARKIASLSTAAAMVVGVGAASALFVDYLADRALAREAEAPATVEPVVASVVEASAETKLAALDAEAASQPVAAIRPVEPPRVEIEAEAPDPVAVAKVTVGPEHAIELPADDPTASPILKLGEVARDVPADETETAAIASYAAEEPKRQKAETPEPRPARKNTEVASLPGVDVGGLAGHPSGDDESARKTTTKNRGGEGSARVTTAVNMRSGPKKGSKVLTVVPAGSAVSVHSCDGWCQITYDGRKGWVYKSFLTGSKPRKQQEAEAASTDKRADPARRIGISSRL